MEQKKEQNDQPPEIFDKKYRYVDTLGKGGFGVVYLAKEKLTDRLVAIKCLREQQKDNQQDIVHEIQTISKLNHPNIVQYLHYFFEKGQLYLVMEYCSKGSVLNAVISDKSDYSQIFSWVTTLAETLQFIHENNIIHHDIKPANILLSAEDEIKISDFGVANIPMGTRAYMAPELSIRNDYSSNDPRIDIYALGVTCIELITGQNPFWGLSPNEIIWKHERAEFGIQGLSQWIQDIILKAIHQNPELRFQSMRDFQEAISAKHVPNIVDKDVIEAGNLAEIVQRHLNRQRWKSAETNLQYGVERFPNDVGIRLKLGEFYLKTHKIKKAKDSFEKALSLNPRINVQKEIGWVALELEEYPTAISLLTDYVSRNSADYEAHNLLLKCYYQTGRYEYALDYVDLLLEYDEAPDCMHNNAFIIYFLLNGSLKYTGRELAILFTENSFVDYNLSVIDEQNVSWNTNNVSTAKPKLLYQDYRFPNTKTNENKIEVIYRSGKSEEVDKYIFSGGRSNFNTYLNRFHSKNVSRRHFAIINRESDVWFYDLGSTRGSKVDGKPINRRMFLSGLHDINIADTKFKIKTDSSKVV